MKFFVSYSRSVQDKVREIIASLRDEGEDVWWDQDLRAGQDWWATILNNIEACDVCLFMISEKSVQSSYCMEELRYVQARNRLVLPFVMDTISYTMPPEIMKSRIQYEIYSGTPSQLKDRIRTTCKGIDWTQYKNRYAVRPPEPNTGSSNLADRLAKAIALAQEGVFEGAVQVFNDVAHNDHVTFGDFCHTWVEKINRYKEVLSLASHAAMKRLARPKWEAFLKEYEDDDRFDPFSIEKRIADINTPSIHVPPIPISTPSPQEQRVLDLLEQIQNIPNEDWGTQWALMEEIVNVGAPAVPLLIVALQDSNEKARSSFVDGLGMLGDVRAVEPLIEALQDKDADVRRYATMSLSKLGSTRAVEPLIGALQDKDLGVRSYAVDALGSLGDMRAVEPLIDALKDVELGVRYRAVDALGSLGDMRAVEPLIAALQDSNKHVKCNAASALGSLGDKRAVDALTRSLEDEDEDVKKRSAAALVALSHAQVAKEERIHVLIKQIREAKGSNTTKALVQEIVKIGPTAVKPLIAALQDGEWFMMLLAAKALGELGDVHAVKPLIAALRNKSESLRCAVADALGKLGHTQAVEPLIALLQDNNQSVRYSASNALGLLGLHAVEPLIEALQVKGWTVRYHAAMVLGQLSDTRSVAALTLAIKDKNGYVRKAAAEALDKIRAANPDA